MDQTGNYKAVKGESKIRKYIIIAIITLLALIAVLMIMIKTSGSVRYSDYFEDGREYYLAEDYNSAITYLSKAVKLKSTEESIVMLAECYKNINDTESIHELLEKYGDDNQYVKRKLLEMLADDDSSEEIEIGGDTYSAEITSLGLSGKKLKSSNIGDLGKFRNLQSLNLSNNKISDINVLKDVDTLEILDLANNDISDISALSSLKSLRTLYLDNNKVEDYTPLYSLNKLTTLSIKGMDITESQLKELQEALPKCRVHSEQASEDVVDVVMGNVHFKSDVVELDLSGKGINDISELSKCENLRRLDLRNNDITDISALMDLPDLEWLCLRGNQISNINSLMGLVRLSYLDLQDNSITRISSLASLSNLQYLYLGGNSIVSFSPLADFKLMSELGLENTGFTDSDFKYIVSMKNLDKLYIANNEGLSEKAVNELKTSLPNCKVSTSALVKTITLGKLDFQANADTVDASNQSITDLTAAKGFTNVKTLILSDNMISDVTPLFGLITVRTLNISNNNVTDVTPLIGMTRLESLNIEGNDIEDISSITTMSWLKELYLSADNFTQEQINEIHEALPNCEIIVDGKII